MVKPVSLPDGTVCSISTCSTRAPRGPCLRACSNRCTASASPSADASTRPSGRFRTQPWMFSRPATACVKYRKPTPCTRPLIIYRRALRMREDSKAEGQKDRRQECTVEGRRQKYELRLIFAKAARTANENEEKTRRIVRPYCPA